MGLDEALAKIHAAEAAPATANHLPEDPYDLKASSHLVYEIFRMAYRNRDKTRSEIDRDALAAEIKQLNSGYAINPKPFNGGRNKFAANLANPNYRYNGKSLRDIAPPAEPVSVPRDAYFEQSYINAEFRKLLYAACCWGGSMEPSLQGDREKLVDLLVGLGFYDAEDDDQVQALVFFITGEKYRREETENQYRHMRASRK